MRLWADIHDSTGARLGDGAIALRDASVTRVLDGVGTIAFSVPYSDSRAISLLQNERGCQLYIERGGTVREIGRGTIRKLRVEVADGELLATVTAPDDLDGLTRVSTKLRRKYSAQSVTAIASDLVSLVGGWTVSASGGGTTDARFDGVSVFKALLSLAEHQGLHVRAGTTPRSVELGAFGASSGLRLVNAAALSGDLDGSVGLIESIRVEQDSEAVCTRLYPIGAGIGEAWLTIERATRNLPYTRQVVNINGIDQHFLEDFAAVAQYGVIEKMGRFADIAPLSNSAADLENAANALYDIAAAWLARYCVRQDVYRVTVRALDQTLRPGDRIRLVYNGAVERDGARAQYLDTDGDFWITEVTERFGVGGAACDLVLSSIDRHAGSSAAIVIGALEDLEIDGVSVKPYLNRVAWVFDRVIDPLFPAIVPVRLTDATQRLNRCLVKIRTRAFISTVQASVNNTTHRHTLITNDPGYTGPYYWRPVYAYDSASETGVRLLLPISVETSAFALQTGTETDEDFITLDYGLQQDTQTPAGLRITINGTDRTTALGGPWLTGGGAGAFEIDVTDFLAAESLLQQEHLIRIECESGQGEVEIAIEVYETIQSITV
ncbi:MAG: hypothetical protein SGJ24_08040 [Chloroflexota bacterium]|nr:hypothetical protein [Chloroflexota bacterium]